MLGNNRCSYRRLLSNVQSIAQPKQNKSQLNYEDQYYLTHLDFPSIFTHTGKHVLKMKLSGGLEEFL
jgi:hypothetical protein